MGLDVTTRTIAGSDNAVMHCCIYHGWSYLGQLLGSPRSRQSLDEAGTSTGFDPHLLKRELGLYGQRLSGNAPGIFPAGLHL